MGVTNFSHKGIHLRICATPRFDFENLPQVAKEKNGSANLYRHQFLYLAFFTQTKQHSTVKQ